MSSLQPTLNPKEALTGSAARFESFLLPDRYQPIRTLRTHPASQALGQRTLLAIDQTDGHRVVIQACPANFLTDDGRFRLENHLHATSRIRNTHFLEPTDWQTDGAFVYRARRDVRALSVEQLIGRARSNGVEHSTLSANQCAQFARGLLEALHELHAVDCVRQDFRLNQILVHENRPLLIAASPGLFVAPQQRDERWSLAFSTVASPELSGLIEHDIAAASDLYSIGCLMFQLLAGRPPFEGAKLGEVLCQHLTAKPNLALLNHAPEPLIHIIDRLLNKQPQDRYQSAQAVIHDLDQLQQIQDHTLDASQFVLGRSDQRDTIVDSALVGRRKERLAIEKSIDQARQGQSKTLIVQSDSGIGKTRLIVESLRHASAAGFEIYRGAASSLASQKPAAALTSVIQQLIPQVHLHNELRQDLQDYEAEITIALPEFARALGWTEKKDRKSQWTDALDSFGQNRVNQAYCKVLTSMASETAPALIWIDDCQWLDPQTIDVLSQLQRLQPAHTLVLLSTRATQTQSPSLFTSLESCSVIALEPLSDVEVQAMIESMAGHLPLDAIRTVVNLANGNPFMASAVLRGMVETGAIVFDDTIGHRRWTIDPDRMTNIQASSDSADALMKRLDQIPEATLGLLSTAAVIGKVFRSITVSHLTGMSPTETAEHLNRCRQQRLVWLKPDGTFAFVHARIRESLVSRLPPERRRALHLNYAEHLLTKRESDSFKLAFHFDEAGRASRALPHALRAAKAARESFSLESAIQSLRIALRGIGRGNRLTFRATAVDLAEALMLNGEYEESDLWFQKAAAIVTSTEDLARIDTQRGELAFRRGEKEAAARKMERALKSLAGHLPTGRLQCCVELAYEVAVQTLHTLLPKWFVGTKTQPPSDAQRLKWRLYSRLAYCYWYTKSHEVVLLAHLRGMNRAEKYPPTPELGQAWSEHAPAMTLIPWLTRGAEYVARSLKVREQLQDDWGQGQSHGFYSVLLYSTSQFEDCIQQSQLAESILLRTGDYWEVNIARYQLAAAHYRQGDLKEAVEIASQTYEDALKIGDYQSTGNIIDVWVRAGLGKLPEEIVSREAARAFTDHQNEAQIQLAQGVHHIHRQRFEQAIDCFKSAAKLAEQAGVVNAFTTPNYVWLATALRMQWNDAPPQTTHHRSAAIAKIKAAVKKAIKAASRFQNDLPHAYRESGYVLAMTGQKRKARLAFEKSIDVAKQQGAKYELALTQHAYGTIGIPLGWANAKSLKDSSRVLLDTMEGNDNLNNSRASISLVDRFDSLLDAGRKIASSLDNETILNLTLDAAKNLLRGERTLIARRTSPGAAWEVFGQNSPLTDHERSALRELEHQPQTLVRDQMAASIDAGGSTSGSLLISPIQTQGHTNDALLVSNSLIQGIYGDNETRIAEYLASAAGSAIEKAHGFQQLATLNQSLEEKVIQRTEVIEARSQELERTAQTLRATQTKLEAARDEAQAANLTKSEFLARMSHEIRTPISAVLGFTELMLRGVIKEDARDQTLQTIHNSGNHLLGLVNDLLDLSKIEANKMDVERIDMQPVRITNDVVANLQGRAAENGNVLQFNIETAMPQTIVSDPKCFRQILTNVIGNAIKFTANGTIQVNLRLSSHDLGQYGNGLGEGLSQLEIEVVDSGIGMTPAQVENIFDPFVQADSSVTRRFGGTGLGLSISKQLAESLGGGIRVTSQPNFGSTFTIHLNAGIVQPHSLVQPAKARDDLNRAQTNERLTVDLKGLRVFVADDAETNRELLNLILTNCGAAVTIVENGREAVDSLTENADFDVVLMDMQMPVLDGYSAVAELREQGFEAPIIALTANTMKGDRERCMKAGCSDYLSKPIDLSMLLATLAKIAGVKTTTRQVTTQEPALREATSAPAVTLEPAAEPAAAIETHSLPDASAEHMLPPDEPFRGFAIKFLEKLKRRGPELAEAIIARDSHAVAALTHWATGTGGTVQLMWLAEQFRTMETAAIANQWSLVDQLHDLLGNFLGSAAAEQSPGDHAADSPAYESDSSVSIAVDS